MRTNKYILLLSAVFIISFSFEIARSQNTQYDFDELLNTIKTGNAYQRAEAIPSFSQINDERVVPILIDLIKDEDNRVRTYSVQQLARLADKRSTEALSKALSDTYGNVRRYAAEGILKIGDSQYIPELVSSVINNLPDSKTSSFESRDSEPALEAIAKMSQKAPSEIIKLLNKIDDKKIIEDNDWWILFTNTANCLGTIGDKAAYESLKKAQESLESNHQDYKTWYAIKKALASIDPWKEPFNNTTADILNSIRTFKITEQGKRERWIIPLSELVDSATNDLSWALKFKNKRDDEICSIAIAVLGEIGGKSAAEVLRQYITEVSQLSNDEFRNQQYKFRSSLANLLNANSDIKTVEEIIYYSNKLDSNEQQYLASEIIHSSKIPINIKIKYYESIVPDDRDLFSIKYHTANSLTVFLAKEGGQKAGEYLSDMLLDTTIDKNIRIHAVDALSKIKNYDSMPTLVKASKTANPSAAAIAKAMVTMKDKRAIPALKDLSIDTMQNQQDKLWTAVALAKFDVDYSKNAEIIRKALPDSLEQAQWLKDDETVDSVALFIKEGQPDSEKAINTLVTIGTEHAFKTLVSKIDLETITNPAYEEKLCNAGAKMAENLGDESKQYYQEVAFVLNTVQSWFRIAQQQARFVTKEDPDYNLSKKYPSLVRKIWITETNKKLDLLKHANQHNLEMYVPLLAISDYFDEELVPVLERIAKEDIYITSSHGKYSMVDFYMNRSNAAKILTDKTGKEYTFVDVDGQTHPGGWNPSQEK